MVWLVKYVSVATILTRQQAITVTWANVDSDLCRHIASLGHNELSRQVHSRCGKNEIKNCVLVGEMTEYKQAPDISSHRFGNLHSISSSIMRPKPGKSIHKSFDLQQLANELTRAKTAKKLRCLWKSIITKSHRNMNENHRSLWPFQYPEKHYFFEHASIKFFHIFIHTKTLVHKYIYTQTIIYNIYTNIHRISYSVEICRKRQIKTKGNILMHITHS